MTEVENLRLSLDEVMAESNEHIRELGHRRTYVVALERVLHELSGLTD